MRCISSDQPIKCNERLIPLMAILLLTSMYPIKANFRLNVDKMMLGFRMNSLDDLFDCKSG